MNIPKIPFIVQNGDLLTNIDYEKVLNYHVKSKSFCNDGNSQTKFEIPYGVVNIENDDIISLDEKPLFIRNSS